MLQINFSFFNVESIREFNSNFVAIYSATSYTFGFPSIIKRYTLDIIKLLVNILSNQNNKFELMQVDKYGSMARYSD